MRMRSTVMMLLLVAGSAALADDAKIKLPNLVGKSFDQAKKLLEAAGSFSDPDDTHLPCPEGTPDVDGGVVQCQELDPGTLIGKYEMVRVYVMAPPNHKKGFLRVRQLRPLVNKPRQLVKDKLKQLGFDGTIVEKPQDDKHSGGCGAVNHVCAIEPDDELDPHGTVTLWFFPE